jgi:NADPH:quinone reductase-like Zn-dependent oxidoreductase
MKIEEIEKPTPRDHQVLIQVRASSVNAADYRPRAGSPFFLRFFVGGILRPKDTRLGSDVAGRVEAVGANVKQFRPGDEVFGFTNGAFAEYGCSKESSIALKPANVSFEEAAAVPVAAITALQGLRDTGRIQPGQKVLIQGASGGVGIFAIQLAKYFGAEVTAVCSTRNLEMACSIGADYVIDYTREDFTRSGKRYDLIFAVNGYHPLAAYKRALSVQGAYVCAGGTLPQFFQAMIFGSLMSRQGGQRLGSMGIAKINQDDLVFLAGLLKDGKIAPVIDRRYPLSEIVEAFRYVEDTHPQGKVVITIE